MLYIFGGNDLDRANSSVDEVLNSFKEIIDKNLAKLPQEGQIHIMPVLNRLKRDDYNIKAAQLNEKLKGLTSERVHLINNGVPINPEAGFYESRGVHLNRAGLLEIVKLIKTHINPLLGLKDYKEYNTGSTPQNKSRSRSNGNKKNGDKSTAMEPASQEPTMNMLCMNMMQQMVNQLAQMQGNNGPSKNG